MELYGSPVWKSITTSSGSVGAAALRNKVGMSSLTLSGGKSQHGYNVAWFDSRYCISGPYCLYYWKIPEELRRGEKNGIMVLGFTYISALSEHS